VHGCVGMDGARSYTRIAEVIAKANPDVVALQELDVGRQRSAKAHQARVLAGLLEMEFHFHPALRVRDEEYGEAILSKHPMKLVKAAALPGAPALIHSEPRGALWVVISAEGHDWHVINTHFGLGREERRRQAVALAGLDWVRSVPPSKPLVVCGDLNSRPASRVLRLLRRDLRDAYTHLAVGHARTFATVWPFICIDYVLVSSQIEVTRAEALYSDTARRASDHFPVFAELAVRTTAERPAKASAANQG
jgi:endonuclease/exonuclease/phosphatase family metal-dependent hydrolase